MCTDVTCVHICAKFKLATAKIVACSSLHSNELNSLHTILTTTTLP